MKPSPEVVFVTYCGLPQGDPDDLLALSILAEKGYVTKVVDWRTTAPAALSGCCVVLRSTWDYHHHCQKFLDWITAVGAVAMMRNSENLIRWNCHKSYLLELALRGVAIVPTLHISQEEAALLGEQDLQTRLSAAAMSGSAEWAAEGGIIVKPAVGLSTFGVKRFAVSPLAAAVEHIRQLACGTEASASAVLI